MRRGRALALVVAMAVTAGLTGAGPASAAISNSAASAKPVVSKLSVRSGPSGGGTRVTLTGKHFVKVTKVEFGSAAGRSLKVISAGKLQVTAPRHAAGVVNVEVVAKAGKSAAASADRFTYVAPPSVSGVSPSSGPAAGGSRVTVTGSGFLAVKEVLFGTVVGSGLTVESSSEIQVTAPAGSAGQVDIRVVTAYGTSAIDAADQFAYQSAPASGLTWSAPTRVDGNGEGNLLALSCPTATDCLALDGAGDLLTWNGTTWSAPTAEFSGDPQALSCPSTTFCAAVGYQAGWVYSGGAWTQMDLGNYWWESVNCTSATFCLAYDSQGDTTEYNGSKWSTPTQISASYNGIQSLSCVSASFCLGIDGNGSTLTWNGSSWSESGSALGEPGFTVSCTSASFCMMVDPEGDSYTFNGSAWSGPVPDNVGFGDAIAPLWADVSCTSPMFCMVVDNNGDAAMNNGTTWTGAAQPVVTGNDWGAVALSCAAQTCAAIGDLSGSANTFVSGAWTGQVDVDSSGALQAVSCPTTSFCAAVDLAGDVVTDSDGTWRAPVAVDNAGSFTSVSCTSASFCLAVDRNAQVWQYNGSNWTSAPSPAVGGSENSSVVSCVSPTFCAWAGDDTGLSIYDGSSWTTPDQDGGYGWSDVSCATTTFCVAVNNQLTPTNSSSVAIYNGTDWSSPQTADTQAVDQISCPSATFCAAVDFSGGVATYNGTSWTTTAAVDTSSWLTFISCTSSAFCAAADDYNNVLTFNGTQWSSPAATQTSSDTSIGGLSCATPTYCVAVDGMGDVATGT